MALAEAKSTSLTRSPRRQQRWHTLCGVRRSRRVGGSFSLDVRAHRESFGASWTTTHSPSRELERAARTLARDPAAKARATQILREELRNATTAEREGIIAAITLLERFTGKSH